MFRFLLPLFIVFMGLGFIAEDSKDSKNDKAFKDHGETAIIFPINDYQTYVAYKQKSVFDEKKYTGVFYAAELSFRTKAGKTVTVPTKNLPPGLLKASKSNQSVTIEYLPESPTTIRFDDAIPYNKSQKFGAYFILLIGLYYLYRAFRK